MQLNLNEFTHADLKQRCMTPSSIFTMKWCKNWKQIMLNQRKNLIALKVPSLIMIVALIVMMNWKQGCELELKKFNYFAELKLELKK